MTDDVDPSKGADGVAFAVAQAIQQHGAVGDGWIVPETDSYATDDTATKTSSGTKGAFATVGDSGLDITFDTGEAFVGGSWLCTDTQTTVTLADNTTGQTIELGWDADAGETVLIGERGTTVGDSFASRDPSIPLYTLDTDAGAIVSKTDERTVGKTTQLGAASLDAESELARFLMTAAGDARGSPGNATNEVWRAGSSTSDLLLTVNADGRMALAWNAYYDGSDWRYIVDDEFAFRLAFGVGINNDDAGIYVAGSGNADDPVSWSQAMAVDHLDGWRDGAGNLVYDSAADEVPQARLGGPASSLSQYPLPAGDIDDGSGNGLDADTVDGKEASELEGGSGEWTLLDSHSDTDSSTTIDYDSGTLSTTYDLYRVVLHYHSHGGSTYDFNEGRFRINNRSTSNYQMTNIAGGNTVTQTNKPHWENLGKVENSKDRDGVADVVIRGTSPASSASSQHPTVSARHCAGTFDTFQLNNGTFREDIEVVDQVEVWTIGDAVGEVRLHGRDR